MKIYFTVDTGKPGYPVRYLDAQGYDVEDKSVVAFDPGQAADEFEHAHPSPVYLSQNAFQMRAIAAAGERGKMKRWNEGRV